MARNRVFLNDIVHRLTPLERLREEIIDYQLGINPLTGTNLDPKRKEYLKRLKQQEQKRSKNKPLKER